MTIHRVSHLCLSGQWDLTEQAALQWMKLFHRSGFVNQVICKRKTPLSAELAAMNLPVQPISAWPYIDLRAKKKIKLLLSEHKTRYLLVHDLRDLWLLPRELKSKYPIKIIGFEHRFKFTGSQNHFLHRKLYAELDYLITETQLQKSALVDRLPIRDERLKVIPSGVDTEKFQPREASRELRARLGVASPEEILIGWVGELRKDQGPFEFIEAAFQIQRLLPKVRFVMIEAGAFESSTSMKIQLQNQIESFGLSHLIRIHNYHELKIKLPYILNILDVYCFSAHNEPTAQILFEALASGCAVIASNTGSIPELIEEGRNGLLALPQDSSSLAQAVIRLLQNPKLKAQLQRESRQKVMEQFSNEVVFEKFLSLIN